MLTERERERLEVRLIAFEERAARAVCDVRGTISRAEAEALYALRAQLGKSWDAINRVWKQHATDG